MPSIGRIVHFHQTDDSEGKDPQAAIVTKVHNKNSVDLTVFEKDGTTSGHTSVLKCVEVDSDHGYRWKWLPPPF